VSLTPPTGVNDFVVDLEGRSKSTPCRGNRGGGILGLPTQDPIDGGSITENPVPCIAVTALAVAPLDLVARVVNAHKGF
jgi:hypothetical protein